MCVIIEIMHKLPEDLYSLHHFERPRLQKLFAKAALYPIVVVCAGAGYGKTSAVYDFAKEYGAATAWIQLSDRDNVSARFWENYAHAIAQFNQPFAKAIGKSGFPDTEDKLNQYVSMRNELLDSQRPIIILDDFHLIDNSAVIHFVEHILLDLSRPSTFFLISRSFPSNIAALTLKGCVFSITEDELKFTQMELDEYFRKQGLQIQKQMLNEIMQDTGGCAFAVSFIVQSYEKAPGYAGYLQNAMKSNTFQLMEYETWNSISKPLQSFLICLSLIGHLAVDLISLLADGDKTLISEMEQQNAYVRLDRFIDAYLIHPLFLEFLQKKQELISEEQKQKTYKISGDWCAKNGFRMDALAYYEKIADYNGIISIFFEFPCQIPHDIANYALGIFERAPEKVFEEVDLFAMVHVRIVMCLGQWDKAFELIQHYEKKFSQMPENDRFRKRMLGCTYYCWGMMRAMMCTKEDRYDFDQYYVKHEECLLRLSIDSCPMSNHPIGPWASLVGTSRKGALQEYIDALTYSVRYTSKCLGEAMTGVEDLAQGELYFYQDDIRAAETFIVQALQRAKKQKQFEVTHRSLFYLMRMAVLRGNYLKTEQALKEMETQLNYDKYINRYITYDIGVAWYYYILDLPEHFPDWIKENFAPYGHVSFIENFGNQMKMRYCYLTKNYPLLLSYMQEQKQRESILFGRIEMLAMEACVHYHMKNKALAYAALKEAYETALPNDILMCFIELGKDMRTLTASALKEPNIGIPSDWLENVNRKASSYAKHRAHIIAEYKRANHIEDGISLTPREVAILTDLSHGLSRTEIAASQNISINTVKMAVNIIYDKLGAKSLADAIRIAVDNKII